MSSPGTIKNLLRISAFALCGFVGPIFADDFKSQFIAANATTCLSCPIHVDDEQFLLIRNFTQDGGTTRGTVTFTRHGEPVGGVTVLTAAIVDPSVTPEVINTIVIAGPASVNVSCGDATLASGCFFSYKKEGN